MVVTRREGQAEAEVEVEGACACYVNGLGWGREHYG